MTAVHVLTYSHELVWDLTPATTTAWRRDLERDLRERWSAPLRAAGIDVRCRVVEADSVAQGLEREAARIGAALVVVGPHGRGGISDRLVGSVSSTLGHQATCPVVVIPCGWEPPIGEAAPERPTVTGVTASG